MSQTLVLGPSVSANHVPKGKVRVEVQAPASWVAAVDRAADALGVSRADYIRIACAEKISRDGVTAQPQRRKPKDD